MGTALGKRYPGAEILLTDVNERAAQLAERNLRENGVKNAQVTHGDGYENVSGLFDAIVLNPPIRTGKEVIYGMFAGAKDHLKSNGALYIVIRKQQGAPSAKKHLEEVFGNASVIAKSGGYWIIRSTKQ